MLAKYPLSLPDTPLDVMAANRRAERLDDRLARHGWQLVSGIVYNGRTPVVCVCDRGHEDDYVGRDLEGERLGCRGCETERAFEAARVRRCLGGWTVVTPYLRRRQDRVYCRCNHCHCVGDVSVNKFLGTSHILCHQCFVGTSRERCLAQGTEWTDRVKEHAESHGWELLNDWVWGPRDIAKLRCPEGHAAFKKTRNFLRDEPLCDRCIETLFANKQRHLEQLTACIDALLNDAGWRLVSRRIASGTDSFLSQCPSGHEVTQTFEALAKQPPYCEACQTYAGELRLDALLKSHGHRLVGGDRSNTGFYVRCECPRGHVTARTYEEVRKRPSRCEICIGEDRLKRLVEKADSRNWECLTEAPILSTKTNVLLRCKCGAVREDAFNVMISSITYCKCHDDGRVLSRISEFVEERGGECLTTRPITSVAEKVTVRCKNGHEWQAFIHNLLSGSWCAKCHFGERRITTTTVQAFAAQYGGRCLSDSVPSHVTALLWECREGHRFTRSYCSSRNAKRFCAKCNSGPLIKRRRKVDRRAAMLKKCCEAANAKGGVCISTSYHNTQSAVEWECAEGHRWSATPANVVFKGSWCPTCAKNRRLLASG